MPTEGHKTDILLATSADSGESYTSWLEYGSFAKTMENYTPLNKPLPLIVLQEGKFSSFYDHPLIQESKIPFLSVSIKDGKQAGFGDDFRNGIKVGGPSDFGPLQVYKMDVAGPGGGLFLLAAAGSQQAQAEHQSQKQCNPFFHVHFSPCPKHQMLYYDSVLIY